jgi:hypothetical protein
VRWLILCSLLVPSVASAGERCGPNTCGDDETCCNYGCGICVPKEGDHACIDLLCEWGKPYTIVPVGLPTTDDFYDRESVSVGESDLSPEVIAIAQRYVGGYAGLRIIGGYDRGGALGGVGGTLHVPIRWLDTSAMFDTIVDGTGGRALVGFAAASRSPIFQYFGHARWVHAFDESGEVTGGIDVGIGGAISQPYVIPCPGGGCTRPLPFAISGEYRYRRDLVGDSTQTHEIAAGVYWLGYHVHVGAETDVTLGGRVAVLLRLDYYPNVER